MSPHWSCCFRQRPLPEPVSTPIKVRSVHFEPPVSDATDFERASHFRFQVVQHWLIILLGSDFSKYLIKLKERDVRLNVGGLSFFVYLMIFVFNLKVGQIIKCLMTFIVITLYQN